MADLQAQLESLPGYDIALDAYNDWAAEKFNSCNPFEDKEGNRRVLGTSRTSGLDYINRFTDLEKSAWRRLQKTAWLHDKCFLGSCGVGLDCGIGLVPLAVFFLPGLGALVTYVVHAQLISVAQEQLYLPAKLVAKLQANMLFDFLISLPPLIGAFLAWMNGCLTRNAGMVYMYLEKLGEKRAKGHAPTYVGTVGEGSRIVGPQHIRSEHGHIGSDGRQKDKRSKGGKPEGTVMVGEQQEGIR